MFFQISLNHDEKQELRLISNFTFDHTSAELYASKRDEQEGKNVNDKLMNLKHVHDQPKEKKHDQRTFDGHSKSMSFDFANSDDQLIVRLSNRQAELHIVHRSKNGVSMMERSISASRPIRVGTLFHCTMSRMMDEG